MPPSWRARAALKKWRWLVAILLLVSFIVPGLFFFSSSSDSYETGRHCSLPDDGLSARPGMVWIPAGRFLIGGETYAEEMPQSARQVEGFWMDRTEVTYAQFAAFVAATGYVTRAERHLDPMAFPGVPPELLQPGSVVFTPPTDLRRGGDLSQWWRYTPGANWRQPDGPTRISHGQDAYPVVAITYEDAMAYARWRGHDLPTEAEWEWAARSGQDDATKSDAHPPAQANTWQGLFPVHNLAEDGFAGRAPAGCFQPNAYGLYDMIGNVWELTRDFYQPSHLTGPLNEAQPSSLSSYAGSPEQQHVIKGGSYLCAANYCKRYRAEARQGQENGLAAGHIGFRTIYRPHQLASRP